jgi:anthranilate/para-aminobenzoate synthase component I
MVREGDELHFSVGSGITAGSVPAREYEETLHKAGGLRRALEAYEEAEEYRALTPASIPRRA